MGENLQNNNVSLCVTRNTGYMEMMLYVCTDTSSVICRTGYRKTSIIHRYADNSNTYHPTQSTIYPDVSVQTIEVANKFVELKVSGD